MKKTNLTEKVSAFIAGLILFALGAAIVGFAIWYEWKKFTFFIEH